jgi:hypothetical protein
MAPKVKSQADSSSTESLNDAAPQTAKSGKDEIAASIESSFSTKVLFWE